MGISFYFFLNEEDKGDYILLHLMVVMEISPDN